MHKALTNRGEYLHGPHGGLDVEPELLQGQKALPLEVLQLSDQDQVLLHQGPHRRRQCVVDLAVLKGRLLFNEAEGQAQHNYFPCGFINGSEQMRFHILKVLTFLNAHRVIVE